MEAQSPRVADKASAALVLQRGHRALAFLLEAYQFAVDLGRPVWDFAVEIEDLRSLGLTKNDFRWLVCAGYVEHRREVDAEDDRARSFETEPELSFSKTTCFVLTEAGVAFVRGENLACQAAADASSPQELPAAHHQNGCRPVWDRDRQELRVGRVVVKQFKVPAANQERVLAAFEEEGWPIHIDDPLPPSPDQDPKRRLHDTINSLNRNQKCPLIRFVGDGTGQGVRWEFAPGAPDARER
ncbi:MAG: hypothetical protein NUV77_00550 [Thermoguttaceae bacterium]|jgi:hypothetical protein|nr:hypothetical protein [Thermoguttaceae bacterium]